MEINPDRQVAWETGGCENAPHPGSQTKTRQAAQRGEHRELSEELPDDAAAGCAHGQSDRELTSPPGNTCQQQVNDV
jgi:hypothetical protein